MTVLWKPRHPGVERALVDARQWCTGCIIDERPALAHAMRVAVTLGRHVPRPHWSVVAGVLLHDAPEFAPASLDLDAYLHAVYGPRVGWIVRSLEAEHLALDTDSPITAVHDVPVLLASTADKIVALCSLRHRADASGDPAGFLAARPRLLALLPHFRAFHTAASPHVPDSMAGALRRAIDAIDHASTTARA